MVDVSALPTSREEIVTDAGQLEIFKALVGTSSSYRHSVLDF